MQDLSLAGLQPIRYSAVDGLRLSPGLQLFKLFEGNDFRWASGYVGCCISHIDIWTEFLNRDEDLLFVLEDDVTLRHDFVKRFKKLLTSLDDSWDVIFLGYHRPPTRPKKITFRARNAVEEFCKGPLLGSLTAPTGHVWLEAVTRRKALRRSIGGTFAYLLNREGCRVLLEFIDRRGLPNAIDTMIQKSADELRVFYCSPRLVFSELYAPGLKDSDVQDQSDLVPMDVDKIIREQLAFLANHGLVVKHGVFDPDSACLVSGAPTETPDHYVCTFGKEQFLAIPMNLMTPAIARHFYNKRLRRCDKPEFNVDDIIGRE